ncbi:MAG: 2Fe-2S iron-sulfur cluster binding domain-containing protein, partial [Gammaproteobacteria bacterium]|nr:2Fe-2S iron-sulfur cluster binding domain-containing protein [Gammaproteobacteria bacterium]
MSSVEIEIDGKTYPAEAGEMLIEVTDRNGIRIPRFCYHQKLSIAANCRMCLIEVERAPKPLPACATPVTDGMKVHTKSEIAAEAQKGTMEFLLINHPLDCPVCDQGGECPLQDQALGYGKDNSRFMERKRSVPSDDIGPLIATEMTRCIHCTRCVRFGEEVAGVMEMGAPGRGEHVRISTFLDNTIDSEVSGNMIDLCPVGALTSKPFRFAARSWELTDHQGISPHDCLGSNILIQTLRNRVERVVPKENPDINECWIADRDR